jgi:hypothetical protein
MLPRHRGAWARVGGLSWCRMIRRSEGHLVFGRLVQAHRDQSRIGTHRPLSPEDLYRLPDLCCVQRIERMADLGRMVPVSSGRAAVILVPCVVCYHWRSLLRADATSPGPTAQAGFSMTCLTCVSSAVVRLEGQDCLTRACGLPEILAGPSRRFADCVFGGR